MTAAPRRILVLATMPLLVLCASGQARAQACDNPVARAVSVQGQVEVRAAGGSTWEAAVLDGAYCAGDAVRARANSRASLALLDQSVLRIRENSELTLEGPREEESYVIELLRGAAHFLSRSGPRRLEVKTPFTVAGVRGTEFFVMVASDRAEVTVLEGRVIAANAAGSLNLGGGQTAVARAGSAPLLRVEARPRDAVRWTLHYPPVLQLAREDFAGADPWRARVRASIDALEQGDLVGAFQAVDAIGDSAENDPRFLAYRASLHLAVGGVDAAAADLERARARGAPAEAVALEAVVAVAQNDPTRALELAQQADSAGPETAAAALALSYAHQMRFDLEAARASAEAATRREPENALAWARLAELRSSLGDRRGTTQAAERAVEIDSGLSRTLTVRGFAALAEVDTAAATVAFERAIGLDQADPLPRLGLGLATIRRGQLDAGARQIEIAASLDPNNALIRSYLGKAYFEEKRRGLDEREFALAKTLDPNDPTPWFYDAIAKQTTNRPVEALQNLEEAIARNDNRAVYRSRLLLDSDLAARSAALGRIYSDLGFQNLALVEGWRSVNSDPSNFSAHRLLADSYAARPRHEIARVSELLQSQLLQPANTTPIQPLLAESNLFLISSQGPAALSFTEFNPLFNRNQANLLATGLAGEDETWSGEGIVSGIYDRLSFSGGFTGFWSEGYRPNNDQQDRIGTVFAQFELSPDTSVQAEFRHRDRENGDLELRFFDDDFSRAFDQDTETYTARAGLRHALSPNSTLLLSYIFRDQDSNFEDAFPPPPFPLDLTLDIDQTGHSGEVQYLHRSGAIEGLGSSVQSLNLIVGLGVFDIDSDETSELVFSPSGSPFASTERKPSVEHVNLYGYGQLSLLDNLTLTVGLSADFFDEDDGVGDEHQFNPKLGITWNPSFAPGMTLRAAAFRTFKRTLITDQTLEPTQVAGFNQFFDEPNATEGWRYGGGIDQKFSARLFGGIEFSKRDLDVPQVVAQGNQFNVASTSDREEYLARSYLFWSPHDWVALRAEYQFERMERDPFQAFGNTIFDIFKEVDTHRVPFGIQFFHPSGVSSSLGATYLAQEGKFFRQDRQVLQSGDRHLWFLDFGLRYRLPRRYGSIRLGVNNLLDQDASYQATDVRNPGLRPGRFVFGSVTLAIP